MNLAAADLADPTLGDDVLRLLQEHGVPAEWLCLELTENAVAGQPERAAALMHRLHAAGVTFALDDVGTGRLSLAQLTGLPLSELKVDRSFVGRMTTDRASNLVVRTVIDLGAKLGLTTVAEGVEDVATLAALTNRGCHTAQGFLLCEPVPAEEFDAWYRREHADPRAA